LESLRLAPWESRRRRNLSELLDRLNPTIVELSQRIEQEMEKCLEAQRLTTHPGVCAWTPPDLRPGNNLLFGAHRARGGLAGKKIQDNPLAINNNVTTAPYPNPPSLNQILHASKEQLSRSLPLDRR
jgi:hypothetical protein